MHPKVQISKLNHLNWPIIGKKKKNIQHPQIKKFLFQNKSSFFLMSRTRKSKIYILVRWRNKHLRNPFFFFCRRMGERNKAPWFIPQRHKSKVQTCIQDKMNAPFFFKLCAQKYKVQFVEIYIYNLNINWVHKIGLWNYIYNIFQIFQFLIIYFLMFYYFMTKTPLYFTHQIKYTNIDFPQILYNQAKGENYKLFFEQSSRQNNFDNLRFLFR